MGRFIGVFLLILSFSPGLPGASDPPVDLVEALFSNPSFLEAKLSPDGRLLASISHYQGKRSLLILDLKTRELFGTTVSDGQDVNDFHWIDSQNIVYHVSQWEIYAVGLYVYAVDKRRSRKVLSPDEEDELLYAGMVDALVHSEERFVFKAFRPGFGYFPDLYSMDAESGYIRKLADNTGEIFHYIVNVDGQPLYALEAEKGETFLLEWSDNGDWSRSDSLESRVIPFGMLPGNRLLLVAATNAEGFRGVNVLDLETGEFPQQPRFFPGYDLVAPEASSPIIDNLTGYIAGVHFHHEKPQNFWFVDGPQRVEDVVEKMFPGLSREFLGYNPADSLVYFTLSSDTQPPVIVQIDLKTLKPLVIYQQFPELRTMKFRPMKPVSFESEGAEFPIQGYLTLPEGPGPYPTVVLVHGGPQGRDTWGFDPKVQLLALNGYAVLQVNYRGSTGYGKRYALNSFGKIAEKSVEDVIAGAQWLVQEGIADPQKLALMGGSFGAFISLQAAARHPDLWQAVIGYAGVYDLVAIHKQDQRRDNFWADDLYADYDEERYASLSPVNHAEQIKAPVLLVHGKSDARVGLAQAKDMVRALKRAGNDVDTLYIGWGVHGLPEEKDRKKYFKKVMSFLDEHLRTSKVRAGK